MRLLLAALAALVVVPATASAGTITYSGGTLTITAADGEENDLTLGGEEDGRVSISDATISSFPDDRCFQLDPQYAIHCLVPERIVAEVGDMRDRVTVNHMVPGNPQVEIRGGDGDDDLKAIDGNTRLTLDGGSGKDVLRSEGGGDVLLGGPDRDELIGGAGADHLEGGDGDDTLTGDVCETPAPDVLDGGAGFDTLTDWGDCGPATDRRPLTVTVNGVADDGRPGEGDDVRDLDALLLYVPATVVGTDGANAVEIHTAGDREPSSVEGRGGPDDLRGGDGRETLDGGAGDDRIEGGFNHDVLTGGPGQDVIHGDQTSGNCGGYGQDCTIPFGNDTIHARDGEADQIDCGAGTDTAIVDAKDTVADDCEDVQRSGGGDDGGAGVAVSTRSLKTALRKGLVVRLTGFAPGAVSVQARAGRRVVATARATVGADGAATARLRFTKQARRSLARKRSVRLAVRAGAARTTVTVKR